jgi:UDP-MurNAc hydroxylase
MGVMRVTFLGHVGFFVETQHGSVLCDPWFTPAYFGSWFPFPRNDRLDVTAFAAPDFLYVSHLHRDHFDPEFLAAHVDKGARVLLPDFPAPFLERELRALGFEHFVQTRDGETIDVDGLEVTIFALTSPADGPLGDSAIVLGDRDGVRLVNQNDARPGDPDALRALGPYDAHFVQFSGAIWYPVVYDFPPAERTRLAAEKRVNQMARARHYVEWVKAANVFPCAGPPCFLDADLFAMNDVDDDATNIFPDQLVFLAELAAHGIDTGKLIVPGSVVELPGGGDCRVTHPAPDDAVTRPFTDKLEYLQEYQRDWGPWLARERASWSTVRRDLLADLAQWFEPLLTAAPVTSAGIAGLVVLDVGDEAIAIDFVESRVRAYVEGEPFVYKVTVDRRLVETLVDRHVEDWVNLLFLSCRFRASRPGPFNEYVMTFFKALSPERIAYVEGCYRRARRADEFFERDGWRIERYCPHRQADLTRFADIEDGVLTCALHHWQFDLATGRCLTSDDKHLRCERIEP